MSHQNPVIRNSSNSGQGTAPNVSLPNKAEPNDSSDSAAIIAEATAAAINAAVNAQVDADAVDNAVLVAASAANLVDAAGVPTIPRNDEATRKRPRETKAVTKVGTTTTRDPQKGSKSKEDELAARRVKDRERYSKMTEEERGVYNAKRRDFYHKQSEDARKRRRERERLRYHGLTQNGAKERNSRRAQLERERYQRLSQDELDARNRKRRERAALKKQQVLAQKAQALTETEETNEEQIQHMVPPIESTEAVGAHGMNAQPPLDSHVDYSIVMDAVPVVEAVLNDVPMGDGHTVSLNAQLYDLAPQENHKDMGIEEPQNAEGSPK